MHDAEIKKVAAETTYLPYLGLCYQRLAYVSYDLAVMQKCHIWDVTSGHVWICVVVQAKPSFVRPSRIFQQRLCQ